MKALYVMLFLLCATVASAAEREVEVVCDWGKISATLCVPDGGAKTAVVIVAGSGPTDRNGNSGYNLTTWAYKLLSDELVEQGYAVLRYDKRGIGLSTMDMSKASELTFDDYVDDARRCVDFLRSEGFERVVVAGHSEGGTIALCLASEGCGVDGITLLSAPGYAIDAILMRQLSAQLMPQYMGLMVTATDIIQRIKRGEEVPLERIPKELISLFHPSVQRFLATSMAYDPAELMAKVECPVLIISGGRDIQVSVDNGERLAASSKGAKHRIFPNMSHVLKDAESGDRIEQLVSVYVNSQLPLTEGLSTAITDFLATI